MTSYVAPPPKGAQDANGRFTSKIALHWRKSATKFLCVNNVRAKVISIHCPIYTYKNGSCGTSPTTWKFGRNWPTPFKNADFQLIFAGSASAVTRSGKSSTDMNRKSSFPVRLRWTVYVAPKPPPKEGSKRSVEN